MSKERGNQMRREATAESSTSLNMKTNYASFER